MKLEIDDYPKQTVRFAWTRPDAAREADVCDELGAAAACFFGSVAQPVALEATVACLPGETRPAFAPGCRFIPAGRSHDDTAEQPDASCQRRVYRGSTR